MQANSDPFGEAAKSDQVMQHPGELARNLNWLVANSPFVYVGRVTEQVSTQDNHGLIVTRNDFAVDSVIVGDASKKSVTLTTLGGSVGDVAMKASHMPQFSRDTTYLIFTDLARTVYNPITGNENGVFVIADGGVYSFSGITIAGIVDGVIQFDEASTRRTDPQRMAATADDPKVTGSITSVQRAEVVQQRALTLDEFSLAIRAAVRR